jgi:DNA repair protein RecO (recombination protein O)
MPTYSVTGINVGSFNLGESDKVLSIFTQEKGLIKAVAKAARKPGSKITGKADILHVNRLLLATGRSLDIITQAESQETFSGLRKDLNLLSYGLYYAELTNCFAQGLSEESQHYFEYVVESLRLLEQGSEDPLWLCLKFEFNLLEMLGYKPELTFCVACRQIIGDLNISTFDKELGGIVCRACYQEARVSRVKERELTGQAGEDWRSFAHSVEITPKVWKHLVLASDGFAAAESSASTLIKPSMAQAHRLVQSYIEHRIGRRLKALDLVTTLK